jgi:hypothetical protein
MSRPFLRQISTRAGLYIGKTTRAEELKSLISGLNVYSINDELIRIGPVKDGGYLVPDDLEGITNCFSPGVSDCSGFELDLAERGMTVFMADRSVDGPPDQHPRFRFIKKFLGSYDSPSEDLITLDSWYRQELGPVSFDSPDAILQMDIEGAEYEVIHSLSDELLKRFRIIVVEFHRLHQLLDRFSFGLMSPAFRKLLRTHAVVHIHPNNVGGVISSAGLSVPMTMEFTFLRRDRLRESRRTLVFPHPLDHRNVAAKPDVVLPQSWYPSQGQVH